MKIVDLKVMRGPNYWSDEHNKLIVLKLDLEDLEREPTHQIEGFAERLKALMPTLQSHSCSHAREGGFFEVVQRGTWMGHVVEHIALELQSLAGMQCTFGKTFSIDSQGIYFVLVEYEEEKAGRYAVEAAIRIAEALVKKQSYEIDDDIQRLLRIKRRQKLGPSTLSIVNEALLRGIPYKRLNGNSLIVLGHGHKQKKLRATVAGTTCGIGIEIAGDKEETKALLEAAHVPVPRGVMVYDEEDVREMIGEVRFPLVIKPVNGNHGRGITTNIGSTEEALNAFRAAKAISNAVIMEEFIAGDDYRLIVINYKLVAAARRTPASVTGDGRSTIAELIEQVNADPLRGEGHDNMLTRINVDSITQEILSRKNLSVSSVLPEGELLLLKHTANMSTGGTSEDVTDSVHPYNKFLAERIASLVGLDICGIDILAKDLSKKLDRDNGAIVEVNAGPGLRMHLEPSKGVARNIAKPIVDMLFPENDDGRIPIVAITGTNGKTTTTRLIAHLAEKAGGHKVGYTTTDGIYILGYNIHSGDCTGPVSSETILFDPSVDFAVLECARGGMLRSGLAFDKCDISIVTNVSADHLGLQDIHTIEDMARVKAVIPKTTKRDGYAILNADDDLVYDMRNDIDCNIALFSLDENNPRIKDHCDDGGIAAVIENGYLTVCTGKWRTRIGKVADIPLSLNGRAESMIKNLLPAAIVAVLRNFDIQKVREALKSFVPSASQTPGRMNIFNFPQFKFMVDYAHNPDGLKELKKFLDRTQASVKVGIVGVAGDRRDEDFREIGALAAQMFDEIIIRHDQDLRGRPKETMTELLKEGIDSVDPSKPVTVISEELKAIQYAIDHARRNAFITVCTEKIKATLDYLAEAVSKEKQRVLHEMDISRQP